MVDPILDMTFCTVIHLWPLLVLSLGIQVMSGDQ